MPSLLQYTFCLNGIPQSHGFDSFARSADVNQASMKTSGPNQTLAEIVEFESDRKDIGLPGITGIGASTCKDGRVDGATGTWKLCLRWPRRCRSWESD